MDDNVVADLSQVPPLAINPFAPGAVLDINMTAIGATYAAGDTVSIISATGTGFVGIPIIGSTATGQSLTFTGSNPFLVGQTLKQTIGAGTAVGVVAVINGLTADVTLVGSTQFAAGLGAGQVTNGVVSRALSSTGSYNPSASSGIVGVYIENGGQNYQATDTVVFTSGTGAGAAGSLVVGPSTGVNPGVPHYFQERRGYAFTLNSPDEYFFSQPGAFTNMDYRVPTISTDAFTGSPWSVSVDGIQWCIPMPGGDLILTGASAWLLSGTGGGALSSAEIAPDSQNAQPQAYNGANATVMPHKIDFDVIYLQAKGSIYRRANFNLYANIYTGEDMTINSPHLFESFTIVDDAWCEEPYKLMWSVRSDGVLLCATINKPQEVLGWSRSDTQGFFQSVCSVVEPPVDALYLCVQRFINGNTVYLIERMDNRIEWSLAETTWCVDAGLSLTQPQPAASLTLSSATGLGACTGVTGLVGGAGYSAGTTAAVIDAPTQPNGDPGPGAGAVPTLTIVGGVITAIVFSGGNQGINYVNPQLVFTDPANTGSGAGATITLLNSATATAGGNVFAAANVGNVIRAGGGIALITAYTSATQVTLNILSPIVTGLIPNTGGLSAPFASGAWSMTAPITSVGGLFHLAGATVTGLADGNVIPPSVVAANGTLALPALPAFYGVIGLTGYTAVTVGLGFQAQLQSIYLQSGAPTTQGQRKKIAATTARIEDSRGLKMGSNQPDGSTQSPKQLAPSWSNLADVPDHGPNFPQRPFNALANALVTGDIRIPVGGGFATPGQVALQQDNPLPMQVLALIPETLEGDSPQQQYPKKQQPQGRAEQ
jgi:hypothetical protein